MDVERAEVEISEKDAALAEKEAALAEKEGEISGLAEDNAKLAARLRELEEKIAKEKTGK